MGGDHGHYDAETTAFLEDLWGEGYLSPGGAPEVARVLAGVPVAGMSVLDIGCGLGGITVSLWRDHGAARVVGLDVEAGVCAAARAFVARQQAGGAVEIVQTRPGPLPFAVASFDLVFSKDSIVHIADKHALATEVFRVLRPGGWFAASDWLISHEGEPSPDMAHYLACEDLDFGMASPMRYHQALAAAGFDDIQLTNRNAWYREEARDELARLTGPGRAALEARFGTGAIAAQIRTWTAMQPVLQSGEHCPHHLRAQKPV